MALYAFDGTWNQDKAGVDRDTNVVWFRDSYQGTVFYEAGVGTRFGVVGRLVGGIAGFGGRSRIKDALKALDKNLAAGDRIIDVVGFSRGAALAVHFTNQIAKRNPAPEVRFLGIWDCVPAFGLPGNDIDIAWDLDMPPNAVHAFHALSLDERRRNFQLHRLSNTNDPSPGGRLVEAWFRGVHSDVGGGNGNNGLSSIALHWMFQNAIRCGLQLDPARVTECAARRNPAAQISVHKFDPIKQRFRDIGSNDVVHESVSARADSQHNNPSVLLARVHDSGSIAAGAAAGATEA